MMREGGREGRRDGGGVSSCWRPTLTGRRGTKGRAPPWCCSCQLKLLSLHGHHMQVPHSRRGGGSLSFSSVHVSFRQLWGRLICAWSPPTTQCFGAVDFGGGGAGSWGEGGGAIWRIYEMLLATALEFTQPLGDRCSHSRCCFITRRTINAKPPTLPC